MRFAVVVGAVGRRETKVPPRPVNGGAAARYRPERGTDTHLPAVRPAPRRLASAPIRVLRGGSILITTKFPTRPPPPATWRARSALCGGVEPFERPGGRGAPSWGPGTARRSAPVRSVGPRRSSGPGGTLGVERLGGQRPTRSVRYPPARWPGGSVRPLPARYRREKRNETKENERKSRTGRVSSPYPCPAPPRPLAARQLRPGPVHLGPALAGLRGPIRPRRSNARSPGCSRARRTRGARAGGRGRASAEVYAGALAGRRGPENTEGVGYVYVAWLLPARTPRTRQRGTRGAARVRPEPFAGGDRRGAPGGGPYLPTRA